MRARLASAPATDRFRLPARDAAVTARIIQMRPDSTYTEPVLAGEIFGPLGDPGVFDQVRLDSETGTLVWPNGADSIRLLFTTGPKKALGWQTWPVEEARTSPFAILTGIWLK